MQLEITRIQLGVGDVDRSVAFYQALLGKPPASRDAAATVFESTTPPLVLTLARWSRGKVARRSFALIVLEPEHVGKLAVALWRAGAPLRLQDEGIEAHDPDGNCWKVRFLPRAAARTVVALEAPAPGSRPP